eukprot:15365319-Ditylum_brightwellii.AAC.1
MAQYLFRKGRWGGIQEMKGHGLFSILVEAAELSGEDERMELTDPLEVVYLIPAPINLPMHPLSAWPSLQHAWLVLS